MTRKRRRRRSDSTSHVLRYVGAFFLEVAAIGGLLWLISLRADQPNHRAANQSPTLAIQGPDVVR